MIKKPDYDKINKWKDFFEFLWGAGEIHMETIESWLKYVGVLKSDSLIQVSILPLDMCLTLGASINFFVPVFADTVGGCGNPEERKRAEWSHGE